MAKSKFNIGDLIVDSLKLGDGDIKSFLGDSLLYPLAKSIEDAVVTCASATYNGSNQIAQDITVVLSGVTLVENTDYIVTNNTGGTNVGSYNVTVTGIGDYENTASGTFTINKVTPTVVSPVPNVLTYNGSAQELVTAGSTNFGTLKYKVGSDSWSTSIPTRTRGGVYTVYYKVDGDSNINSVAEDTVACSINEKPVTAVVTVSPSTYTYNGSYCEPTVTAKDGETVIDPSEYTVTYSNNLNAGTATVTIYDVIGGDYYVEGSTTFTINKADQAAPTASVTAATYPGTSTASATGGGGIGTLTWTNGNTRTAAGTADTYAYWSGNDNYNASPNSNKVTLSVAKYTPTVTLAATNRQYNGNALYATASVGTPSGGVATKGTIYYGTSEGATTYNVAYTGGSVNLSSVSVTNVGSATVYAYFVPDSTCNDVYNNSGNVSKTFSVSKADQSAPTATGATTTYHNTATATASGGGGQGTLTWTNGNTRSTTGSQDTYAYWAGNSNYNASPNSNMVTLTVNKATDQSVTVTLTDRTYNTSSQVVASATSHGCTFYLGFGSSSTSAPTSWGSANSSISQTNAGTYYVWYKGTADENHSADISATYKGTVTIGKADQSAPTATGATSTYPTEATATASGGGGQGSIEWSNGSTLTGNVGSKTTKARWSGNSNYNASPYSNEVTLSITKAIGSVSTAPTNSNPTYNSGNYLCTEGSGTGTMLYKLGSGSYSSTRPTTSGLNAGSYTLYYKASASTNYNESSESNITVTVAKASGSVSTVPTAKSLTYNGSSQALVNAGSGTGTMMYKLDSGSWGTSIPSGTNATSYTVYYKASASTNYNESTSDSVSVTIDKAAMTYTAPSSATCIYNGSPQQIVSGGTATGGNIYYATSSTDASSSTTVPTQTNVDKYTVYWKAVPDSNHSGGTSYWSYKYCYITIPMTAKFNVTSTSSKTRIAGVIGFSSVEIDGVVQSNTATGYTFSTTGEHTIKYFVYSTYVWYKAFDECSGLTSIDIPNSMESIRFGAFGSCNSLTSVTIPNSVTSIDDEAFSRCSSLTSITIPNSVTSIGNYTFYACSGLTSVNIPSGVTSIGDNVFYSCYSLSSVNIPSGVTTIGNGAFTGCHSLSSINIPSGVTSIGYQAFAACSGLTSVTIGSGVTGIGAWAFNGCTSLTSIVCYATTAPTIQNDTFQTIKRGGTLTVPSGSSGYDVWMGTGNYYLGLYGWNKVEYVEIGGLKWATMNVGANSITDKGLYFQWGDTQGYTASQVGSGAGQKYFGGADYKYGNGTSSPGATGMTKYNSTDGKTVLDLSDDAARANMGGLWRMPTIAEYVELGNAVNTAWTTDYQGSGVKGLVCTDKTDSSKVLFFPACGNCNNGSVINGSNVLYWSSSLYSNNVQNAHGTYLRSSGGSWQSAYNRIGGCPVRGVVG